VYLLEGGPTARLPLPAVTHQAANSHHLLYIRVVDPDSD
jgi:hypothetical protein